ncbi:MAG: hypothetical protein H6733_01545 [Alphaproteobacteria bacterium]|nr:hypothetical protein [Alphaproteobacteria bacterium]
MTLPAPHELLPHGRAAVLLDAIVAADAEVTTCRATVRPTHPYALGSQVPAIVAVELMAQAMGVHRGMHCRTTGEPFGQALLVGVPSLRLHVERLELGDELDVEVTLVGDQPPLTVFTGRVLRAAEVVAEGRLQVYHGAVERPHPPGGATRETQ